MQHNFKDTVSISRSVVTGYKTAYSLVTSIPCHIQPISDNYSNGMMGRDGKDYRMFCSGEVRIGDRLVDQNANKYEVTGASFHKYRSHTHYEATLRGV